jgi:hypothetical protein
VLVGAIIFQGAVVLLDARWQLPQLSFYLGTTVAASLLFGFFVLRPLGSVQATASFKGAAGYRHGEFLAAWSVLPVRREAVLRGVYLHGLLTGAFVWTLVMGANLWGSWLATGELGLVDRDGDPVGWIMWPAYGIVPSVAAFLVAGAAGNVPLAFLSFGCAVLYLPVQMVGHELGWAATTSLIALLLLLVVGSLPAFLYLGGLNLRAGGGAAGRAIHPQSGVQHDRGHQA